ncbi:MAG: hypothetical protein QM765_41990 [Myxococcales bacterium]
MARFEDLAAALADVESATELDLDLSQGTPVGPELAQLRNLEFLRLRECPERPEVSGAVAQLPRLKHLSISAKGKKLVLPAVFQQMALEWLEILGRRRRAARADEEPRAPLRGRHRPQARREAPRRGAAWPGAPGGLGLAPQAG